MLWEEPVGAGARRRLTDMQPVTPSRRLAALAFLLVAAFCALGYRLVDIQVFRHEELLAKARHNTERAFHREPPRGEIRDIRGHKLATTIPVKTVVADPTLIHPMTPHMARVLAPLLRTNEAWLNERLTPRLIRTETNGQPVFGQYVVLKHKVPIEEWEGIHAALTNATFGFETNHINKKQAAFLRNLRQRAVFTEEDMLRVYPNQSLAAHVIGFVNTESDGRGMTGADGIERVLNAKLNGVAGWRLTETDRYRRELVAYRAHDVEARPGLNVVLTLDARIQQITEQALAEAMAKHNPVSASAVVVRPKTGEILALATLPGFDPNEPGLSPVAHWKNRVTSDIMEPGSTFKIVVVSGALNEDIISLKDHFHCENGSFIYAGRRLRDHHAYGVLSVEGIITKSSNIGSAKIGIQLGEQKLHDYIRGFGFGSRTGIPLPGEVAGIVHPLTNWTKLSISRIPMGHEVASTPLQMVMAMSAIANEGRLMRPMIVNRLEDAEGNVVAQYQPELTRLAVGPEAAREMVQALKTVTTKDGTAPGAALEHWTVAGKTGTAQKAGAGGYLPGKYFSSFIGFFPADNPELCISVVLDEPHNGYYGGSTAAPIFHAIADQTARYLNIPPDRFDSTELTKAAGKARLATVRRP
jgi:cell division protein FtsI/penicillin-binding protein 2